MPTKVSKYGDTVVRVEHEPGNGTRYEAVGVRLPADFPDNEGGWLISFPLDRTAHFFKPAGFLAVSYVAEKLSHQANGHRVAEVDLHEMTKCIGVITGRTHNAATDAHGEMPVVRLVQ
jgi:hypothetical protein